MGSMKGRASGYCAGYGMPGYANSAPRRAFGRGRGSFGGYGGGGRGWRHMVYATGQPGWMRGAGAGFYGTPAPYPAIDPAMEKQALQNQASALKAELDSINRRLAEVEKGMETE